MEGECRPVGKARVEYDKELRAIDHTHRAGVTDSEQRSRQNERSKFMVLPSSGASSRSGRMSAELFGGTCRDRLGAMVKLCESLDAQGEKRPLANGLRVRWCTAHGLALAGRLIRSQRGLPAPPEQPISPMGRPRIYTGQQIARVPAAT